MDSRHKINNLMSKLSILVLILFSMFANTAILGFNSTPSYAYSPCNCVIFAMDDIADYGLKCN